MKYTTKVICVLLCAVLFFCAFSSCSSELPVDTASEELQGTQSTERCNSKKDPEKRYCNLSVDDQFSDRKIWVHMMPSSNCREYTVEDFSDINCVAIKETYYKKFDKRIITVTIGEPSKENVLAAVKILETRDDVHFVEPVTVGGEFLAVPTDSYYSNTASGYRKALDKIKMALAWDITTGYSSISLNKDNSISEQ